MLRQTNGCRPEAFALRTRSTALATNLQRVRRACAVIFGFASTGGFHHLSGGFNGMMG